MGWFSNIFNLWLYLQWKEPRGRQVHSCCSLLTSQKTGSWEPQVRSKAALQKVSTVHLSSALIFSLHLSPSTWGISQLFIICWSRHGAAKKKEWVGWGVTRDWHPGTVTCLWAHKPPTRVSLPGIRQAFCVPANCWETCTSFFSLPLPPPNPFNDRLVVDLALTGNGTKMEGYEGFNWE